MSFWDGLTVWEVRNLIVGLAEAWPPWAVLALFIIRRPVVELLQRLRWARVAGIEVELSEARQALEFALEPVPQQADPEFVPRLLGLARSAPRAAVLEAWLQVEREGIAALQRGGFAVNDQQPGNPARLVSTLLSSGILRDDVGGAMHSLRSARNHAAHELTEIGSEQAAEYVLLAGRIVRSLRAGR